MTKIANSIDDSLSRFVKDLVVGLDLLFGFELLFVRFEFSDLFVIVSVAR